MFWRDITLSVWRKKTTGLKTKKRLLPLVLAAALCSSPVWAEEATFTANFKDTDLKSFIETVGANLNKTIIMGPGVQGKVSIRTMTPLNERQYYQLFLNLLEAQGYAVVPMENDVLKVVKSSAAKVEPLPLVGEGSDNYAGDEMVTKVVPVRNVSVRELAPILRQMIDSAGSGNVVNYDPSNVIMLTGRASVVERLTEVIQRVDHAGNRTEEVIPLDNASASEIARVLESLTKNSGENQPATLKSQIVADERTNSVIVSGDPATRDKMRRLIRRLDSEMERSGNSQVFYLKYSKAEDLVDVLKQVSGTLTAAKEEAEGTVGSGREVVSIAASKHSNALIVTAPQDIMQSLQSVIEQLDIRRAQVHVEALIVEVAEGSNINFGVQWASKDAGLMQFANGTQIPIGTLGAAISQAKPQKGSTVISENGATTINPDTNGDLSTLAQLLSGFSGTAVGVVKGDWMALVQAVKNDSSSNVLSTPSITTLDNQEAFFMVGQDVPVLTGSTVGSNNSNPFNTVERKKVGINLLREGLDIPECSLVAILDADKEGFLRSTRSLIQTIGRAARNAEGKVILYADRMTGSIEAALEETNRRREKQIKYNTEHGITPKTIKKSIASSLKEMTEGDFIKDDSKEVEDLKNIDKKLKEYNRKMKEAAQNLEFEEAMVYRDKIKELELLAMKNL